MSDEIVSLDGTHTPASSRMTMWIPAEQVPVDAWAAKVGGTLDFTDTAGHHFTGKARVLSAEVAEDGSGTEVTLLIPVEH